MPPTWNKVKSQAQLGLDMFRQGSPRQGMRFFYEEFLANSLLRGMARVPGSPRRVQCNVCGWSGARFLTHCVVDYVDRNAFCPRCLSYSRHRGFAWLCQQEPEFRQALESAADRPGLVFAPEPGMVELLSSLRPKLFGIDIERRNHLVDLTADAVQLPVQSGSLGFAFCFHVLEHIEEDVRALAEIGRCLAPGGHLVLCVPTSFELERSLCYGEANPRLNGHWYAYGLDFHERIRAAGLQGRSYRLHECMPPEDRRRLAIIPEEIWLIPAPAA